MRALQVMPWPVGESPELDLLNHDRKLIEFGSEQDGGNPKAVNHL